MYSGKEFSALIFGASGGIGSAMVETLEADPRCTTTIALSRAEDGVDLTDEESVREAAKKITEESRDFELIINAAGALEVDGEGPEKSFNDIDPGTMRRAFEINSIGGAMFAKHFLPLLARDHRGVFATLSARVGSIGDNDLGGWMSYRASKAGLNQIIRCASVEQKRRNKESIVIALHPGTIETDLTRKYAKGRYTASREESAQNLLAVCASREPQHTGGFYDYSGEAIPW